MNQHQHIVVSNHEAAHGTHLSYILGYAWSIFLTLTAYLMVKHRAFSKQFLIGAVLTLAMIQFTVQLLFFLHLGQETRPRWRLAIFAIMFINVLILVIGSIWIMANLNYHVMSPSELNSYMHAHEGL